MTFRANILTTTVVTLALGLACSNDSDDVSLHDGTGADGGGGGLGGASAGRSASGGSDGGGSDGGGSDGGGSDGGGTGNASSGGTDDSGGTSSGATGGAATGGSAIGGGDAGGSGNTPSGGTESGGATGGTGGIVCDSPCVAVCQGGTCDCECPTTGGTAGAGGAETGGATTGGAGGDFGTCGGVVCTEAQICCGPPECGYCEPAGASWICHESCSTRPCGSDGLECLNPVGDNPPLVFPGEVCVETQIVTGPTPEWTYGCMPNPCGTDPLDCSCAEELCGDTILGPTCDAADPDTLDLYCLYAIAP